MSGPKGNATGCLACDLPVAQLAELDALMANPLRWPANVWEDWLGPAPKGVLGPRLRRWGALTMGQRFLAEHEVEISSGALLIHYRAHLSIVAAGPAELIAAGLIEGDDGMPTVPDRIDPTQLLKLYDRGIKIGIRGLHLLEQRVTIMQSEGIEVPLDVIRYMVDSGLKLAMSQAAIKARGKFEQPEAGEDEGFRTAGEDVSPRMGEHRVRTIEGERVPVIDRGPKDREKWAERAHQQGYEAPVGRRG